MTRNQFNHVVLTTLLSVWRTELNGGAMDYLCTANPELQQEARNHEWRE